MTDRGPWNGGMSPGSKCDILLQKSCFLNEFAGTKYPEYRKMEVQIISKVQINCLFNSSLSCANRVGFSVVCSNSAKFVLFAPQKTLKRRIDDA